MRTGNQQRDHREKRSISLAKHRCLTHYLELN
jgi:hypothetical protein